MFFILCLFESMNQWICQFLKKIFGIDNFYWKNPLNQFNALFQFQVFYTKNAHDNHHCKWEKLVEMANDKNDEQHYYDREKVMVDVLHYENPNNRDLLIFHQEVKLKFKFKIRWNNCKYKKMNQTIIFRMIETCLCSMCLLPSTASSSVSNKISWHW